MLTLTIEGAVIVGQWKKENVSMVTLIPTTFYESESNRYRQRVYVDHYAGPKEYHEWYPESHPINRIHGVIIPYDKVIDVKHLRVKHRQITLQPGDRLSSSWKTYEHSETILSITVDHVKVIDADGKVDELSYDNICQRDPIESCIESINKELSVTKVRFIRATKKKVKGIESVFSWDST